MAARAADGKRPGLRLRELVVTVPDGTGRRTLLDRIDLEVSPGEVIAVTGASGSGKSTMLSVAGLLRRPDSGRVEVAGVAAGELSERDRTSLRRDHVAIVYQSANLLPALTAMEQLELVGHINGERRASARARAGRLLGDLDLAGRSGQLPSTLSGGERQRVGIARALMSDPSVLLADEPTASLDPSLAADVIRRLSDQARERELATMIVTHGDVPIRRADRHFELAEGSLTEAAIERSRGEGEAATTEA